MLPFNYNSGTVLTFPVNFDLSAALAPTGVRDLQGVLGGSSIRVESIDVTPHGPEIGFLQFFFRNASPVNGTAADFQYPVREPERRREWPFSENQFTSAGHLWVGWSLTPDTFTNAFGAGLLPAGSRLGLVCNVASDSASFNYPQRFSASSGFFVPGVGADDLWTIQVNTRYIYVREIRISMDQAAPGNFHLELFKRSTFDTGGTSNPETIVAHDVLNQGASNSSVRHFTAAPTKGTSIGRVRSDLIAAPNTNGPLVWTFPRGEYGEMQLRANGLTEALAINAGTSVFGAGTQVSISCTWEETSPWL